MRGGRADFGHEDTQSQRPNRDVSVALTQRNKSGVRRNRNGIIIIMRIPKTYILDKRRPFGLVCGCWKVIQLGIHLMEACRTELVVGEKTNADQYSCRGYSRTTEMYLEIASLSIPIDCKACFFVAAIIVSKAVNIKILIDSLRLVAAHILSPSIHLMTQKILRLTSTRGTRVSIIWIARFVSPRTQSASIQ